MTNKVILLDFDGPMIPLRAYFLPNQTDPVSLFDPCAVSMLLKLVNDSNAKLVISSTWGLQGYDKVVSVLETNGISRELLHEDWRTPRRMSSSRTEEIVWWIRGHSEVTHWVAVEDESLYGDLVPNAVKCDAYEGFSWRNYLECRQFLGIAQDNPHLSSQDMINWLKRSELSRTVRDGEAGRGELWTIGERLFPIGRAK